MINRMRVLGFSLALLAAVGSWSSALGQQASNTARNIDQLAQQAERDLHNQNPSKAAAEYLRLLAVDPDNMAAHSNLGLAYYLQGKYTEASKEFRAVLRRKSDLWNIEALCGIAEAQSGQNDTAIAHLNEAFERVDEPSLRAASGTRLFSLLMANGELTRAAWVIEELRKIEPNDVDVLYAAHQIYSLLADQAFQSLAHAAPDSARMYQLQGDEMAQVGNVSGAIAAYKHAIALAPHLSGVHFALGETLHASHSPAQQEEAASEYEQALEDNPGDVGAECRLGDIELKRSHIQSAILHYQQAVQLQPNDPGANKGLGMALMTKGENRQAVIYLTQAVHADPFDESAYYHLSLASRNAGDQDAAKHEMEEFKHLKAMKDELESNFRSLRHASSQLSDHNATVSYSGEAGSHQNPR